MKCTSCGKECYEEQYPEVVFQSETHCICEECSIDYEEVNGVIQLRPDCQIRYQCDCCGETHDEEYTSDYESLEPERKILMVCMYCQDNNTYDEERNMNYINVEGIRYYDKSYTMT